MLTYTWVVTHTIIFLNLILTSVWASDFGHELEFDQQGKHRKVDYLVIGLHGINNMGVNLSEVTKKVISSHSSLLMEKEIEFWFPIAPTNGRWFERDENCGEVINTILTDTFPYTSLDLTHKLTNYQANLRWLNDRMQTLLKRYNLTPSSVILCGFSQGGMMAYSLAAKQKQRVKALYGLNSFLLPTDIISLPEYIFLQIGWKDTIIPPKLTLKSIEILKVQTRGVANIAYNICNICGHKICGHDLNIISRTLLGNYFKPFVRSRL